LSENSLALACIVSQPFAENTFIAALPGRSDCLVFDPGFEPDRVIDEIEQKNLTPAAILNTHGHSDHIAGNQALKDRWPDCPLIIGAGDAAKLTDPQLNLSAPFGVDLISPPADRTVVEGDTLLLAGIRLEVLETPGHSIGHVVFVWKEGSPWIVFGGDVLFRGSVGRTDFPDGDAQQLFRSIRQKLFTLPDDTVVLTGHGEPTTVAWERRTNPYVGERAG
jgi:glyoxylase-like metal-dependent hydrolase (beta-lactamase superfamily II)